MVKHTPLEESSESDSSVRQGLISLVLFIYLTGLWVVLSSSLPGDLYASGMQQRLLAFFQFYTQPLNVEVRGVPYYLYSGSDIDNNHFFEVEITAGRDQGQTIILPGEDQSHGTADRRRYQRLATIVAAQAQRMEDSFTAEIAKAVGGHVLRQRESNRCVVRCVGRSPQPMEFEFDGQVYSRDPYDISYREQAYEADVWIDSTGQVQAIKRSATQHSAPVR
ncbi:MAG: hypothetical protein WDZ51_07500 [Pirellulaceae bacterium]